MYGQKLYRGFESPSLRHRVYTESCPGYRLRRQVGVGPGLAHCLKDCAGKNQTGMRWENALQSTDLGNAHSKCRVSHILAGPVAFPIEINLRRSHLYLRCSSKAAHPVERSPSQDWDYLPFEEPMCRRLRYPTGRTRACSEISHLTAQTGCIYFGQKRDWRES